jgi:hypothetical protein
LNAFGPVRDEIAGKLTAAGAAAVTVNPRAQVPCVLVGPVTVDGSAGIGAWAGTATVSVLAPPPGDLDALAWLEEQLTAVMVTYPGAFADHRTVSHSDVDVPGYVVTFPVQILNPNC